jgi:hypothetical protein
MYKLGLLIACLLVGFKGTSQIDTKKNDSIVTLSETIARKVATDLVRYDFAKNIIKEQEVRIKNYQNKEIEFKNKLDIKDSIIFHQKSMIDIHKEIIKSKKSFEFHGYAGVQSTQFTLREPTLYTNIMLEFVRFSIGAQYFVQPNNPPGYGVILEYNLF